MSDSKLNKIKNDLESDQSLSSITHSDSNSADEDCWTVRVIDSPSLHHQKLSLHRIQQLCNLTHPNILPLRLPNNQQIRDDNNKTYVELPITKRSLIDVIHDHEYQMIHISEDRILRYTDAIASGLAYLHSKQLTHNYLKPSNVVFIPSHSTLELVCIASESRSESVVEEIGLYTPPEVMADDDNQMQKQGDLEANDLWCLGVLLLELCLCKFLWSDLDAEVQARKDIINQCLEEVSKAYHRELVEIISKLLNDSPSARGTAKAIKEDIDRLFEKKSLKGMEQIQADYEENFVLEYNEMSSITITVNVSNKEFRMDNEEIRDILVVSGKVCGHKTESLNLDLNGSANYWRLKHWVCGNYYRGIRPDHFWCLKFTNDDIQSIINQATSSFQNLQSISLDFVEAGMMTQEEFLDTVIRLGNSLSGLQRIHFRSTNSDTVYPQSVRMERSCLSDCLQNLELFCSVFTNTDGDDHSQDSKGEPFIPGAYQSLANKIWMDKSPDQMINFDTFQHFEVDLTTFAIKYSRNELSGVPSSELVLSMRSTSSLRKFSVHYKKDDTRRKRFNLKSINKTVIANPNLNVISLLTRKNLPNIIELSLQLQSCYEITNDDADTILGLFKSKMSTYQFFYLKFSFSSNINNQDIHIPELSFCFINSNNSRERKQLFSTDLTSTLRHFYDSHSLGISFDKSARITFHEIKALITLIKKRFLYLKCLSLDLVKLNYFVDLGVEVVASYFYDGFSSLQSLNLKLCCDKLTTNRAAEAIGFYVCTRLKDLKSLSISLSESLITVHGLKAISTYIIENLNSLQTLSLDIRSCNGTISDKEEIEGDLRKNIPCMKELKIDI